MSPAENQAAPAVAKVRAPPGRLELESSVDVPCSPQAAWDVITDYDRLSDFMPNLPESSLVGRTGTGTLVRQSGDSSLSRKLRFQFVLELVRESPTALSFRQVMGNLRRYEGSWRVSPRPGGVRISYRASVVHGFPLAGRLVASLVRIDFAKIMPAVAAEIARRAARRDSRPASRRPAAAQLAGI